jgi:Hypothetical glycosyl hydrolase family 15/FG-GAP-like repeat
MLNFRFKKMFFKTGIIFFLACFVLPLNFIQADSIDNINNQKYPKLANYFLSWTLTAENVKELAKWDVLILDMENQLNNPEKLREIRRLNPNVVILAYVPAEEITYDHAHRNFIKLRGEQASYVPESWYLHNFQGQRVRFWPGADVMNVTDHTSMKNNQRWNTYLASFVKNRILATGLWDGIFYDNTSATISWVDQGNIDLNNDRRKDTNAYVDAQWKAGTMKLLKLTREANPNHIIIGNSASDLDFQKYLNGRMFETFPTPWEFNGQWDSVTDLYLNKFPARSLDPQIYVINTNTDNTGVMDNYRKMRFGLASTLLGHGYYSFDFGDKSHTQTWWYDEYESFLGKAQSSAYNLLDREDPKIKKGLWRRDFEKAIVIVNSTLEEQTHVFSKESFEKLAGSQDRRVNNGSKINWLKIAPEDGVILLKINTDIINDSFNNGDFMRVFNQEGKQERNGFFAYQDSYAGQIKLLRSDLDNDGDLEDLVNGNGKISIYSNAQKIDSFYPYTEKFKKDIFFTVGDMNNDGNQEIITGAGPGGGPHVRVFTKDGKLINQFFAYHQRFFGGINLAVGDMNNDGNQEIITGAGPGGGPHVRVFTKDGKLINQFFAYQNDFYGGISVAVGDVDGDGIQEIITSPGQGGEAKVRIFTQYGELVQEFQADSSQNQIGVEVIANDLDQDGQDEILVSINNF